MRKCLILIFILIPFLASANLRINEFLVNPSPGINNPETQALVDCNNPTFGNAWIELYNNSKCDTLFLDCFLLSIQTTATNGGTFAFPQGTFIEPHGFLLIGGGNVAGADFILSDYCNTSSLCGADEWVLENDFGWVGLYDNNGNVLDAVFYTENTGQATILSSNPNFDFTPCVPDLCDAVSALLKPNEMTPGSQIIYGGRVPDMGNSLARVQDGQPGWINQAAPSPGTCNDICAVPDDLSVFVEIIQNETCEQANGIATVLISGGTSPYSILWSTGSALDTVFNLQEGELLVNVTDNEGCGDVDSAFVINEGALPDLTVDPAEPAVFFGEFVQLQLVSTNPLSSVTWLPLSGLSCQSCSNPLAGPGTTTIYTVEATDVYGCLQTTTVRVEVVDDAASVFVPNAFTPGQQVNNILYVRSPRIASMEFRIYDRWGNEIFFTRDQETGWDGTGPGGSPLPSGVFIYQLEVVLDNGTNKVYNGNIHLIR